jgi:hypothetical protein
MNMDTSSDSELKSAATAPAAMPEALQKRLLAAMRQASDEEQECREVEQLLRRLRPAEMPVRLVGQLGGSMYLAARQRPYSMRRYMQRGGLAAAILFFLVAGGVMLVPGSAVAGNENQGLVSRNVIESRGEKRVEWRRGTAPVRHYTVVYEDSFVLDDDGTTTVIRVPNTTNVEVEEEYL